MRIPGLEINADLSSLEWLETASEGIRWLPLATGLNPDPEARGSRSGATVLILMEPGRGYPAHRHLGTEDVLVLAGGYRDARGEYRQGEHVHYAAGSAHAPVALGSSEHPIGPDNPACVLYATAPGGVELLEPGAPR